MVSEDLQSLLDKLSSYQPGGLRMTPAGLKSVCAILQSAIQDIEIIERQPCKQERERLNDMPHVVDLVKNRSRLEAKRWLRQQGVEILPLNPDPDGGDAA